MRSPNPTSRVLRRVIRNVQLSCPLLFSKWHAHYLTFWWHAAGLPWHVPWHAMASPRHAGACHDKPWSHGQCHGTCRGSYRRACHGGVMADDKPSGLPWYATGCHGDCHGMPLKSQIMCINSRVQCAGDFSSKVEHVRFRCIIDRFREMTQVRTLIREWPRIKYWYICTILQTLNNFVQRTILGTKGEISGLIVL